MQRPTRTTLLNAVTATGQGTGVIGSGAAGIPPSFDASLTGTGALSGTLLIQGRNTPGGTWCTLASLSLSGTGSDGKSYQATARFMEYAANLTALSGTSATVTCTMAD